MMWIKWLLIFILMNISLNVAAQTEDSEQEDINLQGQVPRVEFENTKYNFGNIYRGNVVSHLFKFVNTGNGILVLNSLHAACGCLNAKIFALDGKTPQNIFKQNEAGVIRVDFDSSPFSGNIVRNITAETNMGSASPTVTLTISAHVEQEFYSTPSLLYIGQIDKDALKTFNINLTSIQKSHSATSQDIIDNAESLIEKIDKSPVASAMKDQILNSQNSLEFLGVESLAPFIEAKLDSKKRISVKLIPPLPIGPLNTKIILWNNSTNFKRFEIPIIGDIIGRVQLSAKYVEFGVVKNLKPSSSERVIIYSSSFKNFAITSVKINLRRVPEMQNLRDSEIFEVKKELVQSKVKFDPDSAVAYKLRFKLLYPVKIVNQTLEKNLGINVSGDFVVKTNDPDYKEITVPFFGVLRKGP